jgi:hypothetical protein
MWRHWVPVLAAAGYRTVGSHCDDFIVTFNVCRDMTDPQNYSSALRSSFNLLRDAVAS